mmetsp:Transcript_3136/g.11368  ORF Transcript_3136/g.11368 Transcript_3136/m.11368 type:complete len:305 (-) Transcript_3136:132-1046(-)
MWEMDLQPRFPGTGRVSIPMPQTELRQSSSVMPTLPSENAFAKPASSHTGSINPLYPQLRSRLWIPLVTAAATARVPLLPNAGTSSSKASTILLWSKPGATEVSMPRKLAPLSPAISSPARRIGSSSVSNRDLTASVTPSRSPADASSASYSSPEFSNPTAKLTGASTCPPVLQCAAGKNGMPALHLQHAVNLKQWLWASVSAPRWSDLMTWEVASQSLKDSSWRLRNTLEVAERIGPTSEAASSKSAPHPPPRDTKEMPCRAQISSTSLASSTAEFSSLTSTNSVKLFVARRVVCTSKPQRSS